MRPPPWAASRHAITPHHGNVNLVHVMWGDAMLCSSDDNALQLSEPSGGERHHDAACMHLHAVHTLRDLWNPCACVTSCVAHVKRTRCCIWCSLLCLRVLLAPTGRRSSGTAGGDTLKAPPPRKFTQMCYPATPVDPQRPADQLKLKTALRIQAQPTA